ncbi:efflux RND transporter permease subunit [Salinibacter grassmerensis]|uniref:efflux RND transporter permease subunit n=1 Tax=Salinibacter grassmerensis TaxID=3040353 RepID=UPI0021E77167|nr:MMPL family transporter [Salinibacter grassmerensis]
MDRLFRALRPFIRRVTQRAGGVLVLAVLATVLGGYGASQLSIDTNIANLVPEDYESVQALNTLQRTVGGERDMAVAISSPSFEANKAFAEDFIPEALSLKQKADTSKTYLTRVEYKREVEFLKDNALYFASNQELRQVEDFLQDQIAEAKRARQDANPFYFELEEDEPDTTEASGEGLEGVYDRLIGTRYPVSDDSTTMVLRFYPSGSNTDIGYIENLYADARSLVDRMDPESYHPEMEIVLAGRLYRQLVEVDTIWSDVTGSFGVGVGTVLLVVILYFLYKAYRVRSGPGFDGRVLLRELVRAPVMGLVIGAPLFMSLAWTGGVAALLFGRLNLMTSTLGLVLFGLGIDFGIHFYARYAEERADGHSVVDAAERTFVSTGQAIAVGAFTTAGALYVLVVADFKGFSEFGAVAGTGVLFALLAMTVVMPALLALLERAGLLDLQRGAGVEAEPEDAPRRYSAARPVVVGGLVAVLAALALAPRVDFQYDFGVLEPEYTEYEQRDQYVDRVSTGGSGNRRNPAYIVADSREAVPKIVEAVRTKMRADTTSPTILAVESLQERFPLRDTAQASKLARIAQIRETATENRYLRDESTDALNRLRRAAQPREPIPLDQVPRSLRKQFTTKDGELGRFVMIYPSVGLSDGRKSIAFAKDVGTITTEGGETYHAGSTSLVAADMLMLLQREAPWMIGGTFVIVALLMLLNFRSLRWAGLALVPLVVGLLWMLLVMEVFGLKVNFYNMVVFPAILGIGNDAGVHMVHRYREEGPGSLWTVLRSTGEHVTMGTLTTMVGFGGLLLSFHPGLNSMGTLAVLGLGTTLLAAVAFLPALLQWLEDREAAPDHRDDVVA